jgi:thiol-disulfide isomerase/thioredoxin
VNSWKTLAVIAAVVTGVIAFFFLQVDRSASTAEPAPDFQGDFAVNGKPIRLSELRGKVVLVDFWAVWCRPCVLALPRLIALNAQYKAKGLEIVGVVVPGKQDSQIAFDKETGNLMQAEHITRLGHQAMLKDYVAFKKIDYLVMTLPPTDAVRVLKAYNVGGIPHAVLIDRAGALHGVFVGGGEDTGREIEEEIRKLLGEKR